jgi:hypothetical protein
MLEGPAYESYCSHAPNIIVDWLTFQTTFFPQFQPKIGQQMVQVAPTGMRQCPIEDILFYI